MARPADSKGMTRHTIALRWLLPILALGACAGEGEAEAAARAAFEGFQDALFRGDRGALAKTLCKASLAALDQIPLDKSAGKQRLVVTGVRAFPPEYEVQIQDPNESDQPGTFVVVREDGRYVVDLVATVGFHRVLDASAKRSFRIEPRVMNAADRAKAAAIAADLGSHAPGTVTPR